MKNYCHLWNLKKLHFSDLNNSVKKFGKTTIHILGDASIDKYNYCNVLGQTTKTPTFSVKNSEEVFLGGAGIVAKH